MTTLHFENYVAFGISDFQTTMTSLAASSLLPFWPFLKGCSGFCPRSSFLLSGSLIDFQDFNCYLPTSHMFQSQPPVQTSLLSFRLSVHLESHCPFNSNMFSTCSSIVPRNPLLAFVPDNSELLHHPPITQAWHLHIILTCFLLLPYFQSLTESDYKMSPDPWPLPHYHCVLLAHPSPFKSDGISSGQPSLISPPPVQDWSRYPALTIMPLPIYFPVSHFSPKFWGCLILHNCPCTWSECLADRGTKWTSQRSYFPADL